ncbi:MAG: hypothetical protein WCX16_03445 [Candidatus Omnitrophota bacterium]|jgi:hypothetical protein
MRQKCFVFIAAFLLLGISCVSAETVCSFDGSWDTAKKEVELSFQFPRGGHVGFKGKDNGAKAVDFHMDLKEIKVLLFDITTEMIGTAKIAEPLGAHPFIQGILNGTTAASSEDDFSHFIKGKFELREGKFFLENCAWAGLSLRGYCSLVSPYEIDLSVQARDVLLTDLFSWLGQEGQYSQGEVSGQVHFSGILDCLAMKGTLFSSGQVGDFRYDNITAGFEGFYPVLKLVETSVTQEGGVSFFLEGNIDLSKDFKNFSEQLAKMKMLPLIRETNVDREWTIRRETEGRRSGETEFKYRLKREREVSGVEEGGMLTIQRSIKF